MESLETKFLCKLSPDFGLGRLTAQNGQIPPQNPEILHPCDVYLTYPKKNSILSSNLLGAFSQMPVYK